MKCVLDTNILIDFLKGYKQAQNEIRRYSNPHISVITWIEVTSGASTESEFETLKAWLEQFRQIPLSTEIAQLAARLRRSSRYKTPDAIIKATAENLETILVTRNTKDFDSKDPGVRVPYTL